MTEIPRSVSIDAHTILSNGYFLLLDASKDWRTSNNPFVKGIPYTRFYLGVPLVDEKNNAVGVVAVFDSYAKNKVADSSLKFFQDRATEIMNILNTPLEELNKDYQGPKTKVPPTPLNTELAELRLKLGRATSRSSLLTVFEKDGSGNAYSQNHSFRFSKFLKNGDNDDDTNFNQEKAAIFNKLYKVGSLKVAASILAKAIATLYHVDFVYILEIRIAELFTVGSEYFPRGVKKIDAENFKHANKLVKKKTDESVDLLTRVMGIHGTSHQNLNIENSFHYKAFMSEFGIQYENSRRDTPYNKGIIMPFFRYNSKLVSHGQQSHQKKVDVDLRSGGYMIALFNKSISKNLFNGDLVCRVYELTGLLKKIYITNK